jgi:hypothetical protein
LYDSLKKGQTVAGKKDNSSIEIGNRKHGKDRVN